MDYYTRLGFTVFTLSMCFMSIAEAKAGKPCTNSDAFYFNVQPKSITVRQGGRAFLECSVSNKCNIRFHWTLNNRNVLNTTRRYQNGSNLVITRVNRNEDLGDFHCIATYIQTGISKESQPAQLGILWLSQNVSVELISPESEQSLYADPSAYKSIQMSCLATGSDELEYRWYKNGRRLKNTKSDKKYVIKGEQLTLYTPSSADNGVYSCLVDNDYGSVYSNNNLVMTVPDSNVANITRVPKDTIGFEGGSARFDCEYDEKAEKVEWRKVAENGQSDEAFTSDGRIRHLSNHSLEISKIIAGDGGTYECLGYTSSNDKTPQAFTARLQISTLSEFTATSFEPIRHLYVVGIGKKFQVACIPPEGFPEPVAYWIRNGKTLDNSGRVRADGIKLVIDSATASDAGDYHCVAENMAGTEKRTLTLYTSRPATIIRHPASIETHEGETVELRCENEGTPYPITAIDWEKDGVPISVPVSTTQVKDDHGQHVHVDNTSDLAASHGRRIHWNRSNGTLVIHSSEPEDSGKYVCVVNTADQDLVRSAEASVNIFEKLKFAPRPIDRIFEKGTNVRVHCNAKGPTDPTVRWLQVGRLDETGAVVEEFQPRDITSDYVRDREGTLYFRNIRFSDAGLYMCVAVSQPMGVINATIKVQVMVLPKFDAFPDNMTVHEHQDVTFRCSAKGFPKPSTYWYFERQPVEQWAFTNYELSPNGTLHLYKVGVQNAGKFECVAGNPGGLKSKYGLLCVKISESNFTHCGQEVGIKTGVGDAVISATTLSPDPDQNVSITTIAIACSAAASYIMLVVCLLSYCAYKRRRAREMMKTAASAGAPSVTYTANPAVHNRMTPVGQIDPTVQTRKQYRSVQRILAWLALSMTFCTAILIIPSEKGLLTTPASLDAPSTLNGSLPPPNMTYSSARHSPSNKSSSVFTRDLLDWNTATAIGSGVFGPVSVTRAFRIRPEEEISLVLIKQLTNKDENVHQMLKEEMELYSKTDHVNVAKLLSLCREAEPVLSVYEYSAYGNLKSFLLMSRHHRDNPDYPAPLSEQQLISIAYQVAQGMEHITDQRFVHRDVAARNILVYPGLHVKISSLSLQNDAFLNEYYMYRNLVFPLRWMSAEALFDDDFSMKSDVWSFGVFLWELYSTGELPYQTMSNAEIIDNLKADTLEPLDIPPTVPDSAGDLMLSCWETDPRLRPTFTHCRDVCGQLHVEAGF